MILSRPTHALLVGTALTTALSATALLAPVAQADPPVDPAVAASFTRTNVDPSITGAAFTVAGRVFGAEKNLVTSGFGTFMFGAPTGGGTLQVYRPGGNVGVWNKVTVFGAAANIITPNQPTIADVDGDGDNDLIVPGGYFFDTYDPPGPAVPQSRGSLTWWENTGPSTAFVRHDVIAPVQPWAYHGAEFADLDGDGNKDILTVGEQGVSPSTPADDLVEMQLFPGNGDGTFDAPVPIASTGGSLPVVHDVNGDGRLDIVSAQYFGFPNGPAAVSVPSYRWYEQTGAIAPGGLTSANFTAHTIATFGQTANGFQIKPVPNFHGDGKLGWVATNHMSKLGPGGSFLPASESVYELTPGAHKTQPWAITTLSNPADPADRMAARAAAGSAAPGVFGYGDIDGDGDVDLAVSGDGDELVVGTCQASNTCARRLFWIEQKAGGAFVQHTLTGPDERFGQAGGAVVADLDGDGDNELAFSSFEQNTLAIWTRQGGGPALVTSAVAGFRTKTAKVRADHQIRDTIRVTPGPEREVVLQFRTCKPADDSCSWSTYETYTSNPGNVVKLTYFAQGLKSWWRVLVEATPQQSEAASGVRKVRFR